MSLFNKKIFKGATLSLFNEKNFAKWTVILPVIGIVVTAFIFVVSGIQEKTIDLDEKMHIEQIKVLKQSKKEAQLDVDNLATFLLSSDKILRHEAKESLQNTITLAVAMIENTYTSHSDLSNEIIIEKIKSRLRNIRIWDGAGYFFIYDIKGNCILLPTQPSLENTNMIDLVDAKGKFTIKSHIEIAKNKNHGFDEWYWYKPNEKIIKKKIGYIKYFEPLGLYIGTARYEEDITTSIKNNLKKNFLGQYIEKNKDHMFIFDPQGKSVVKNIKITNAHEVYQILEGSKYTDEGFFLNHTVSRLFEIKKELNAESSFVRYIPEFDWIIGANTYKEKVFKDIESANSELLDGFKILIKNRVIFALLIVFGMLIVTIYFSNRLKKVLHSYQQSLIEKNKQTTDQKELLSHNLKHDHLTSLPNRLLLADRLEQSIKYTQREKSQVAVVFIDVDKFKSINDSLGHDAGDELLREIAKRLKKAIRDVDTVARFGGDEFVLLIKDFKKISDIIIVIDKVQKSFLKPVKIGNIEHHVTLSIGISVSPDDGVNENSLLKNADIAMYRAKSEGGNKYKFFTAKMNEETQEKIDIEKALHVGVEKEEFVLFYQPLVDAKIGKIIGVEALIRWNHPQKGLVFPDEFIEIAEDSNVMIDMGKWIIEESMCQMVEWKEKGYGLNKMSINIAIKQLEHVDFIKCIKSKLKKTSCEPEWIEMEIVERFAMRDVEKSIEVLNELRELGIDIAIDDFGTGHSSLAYLKNLPITKLKIDRTFVKNILNSHEDRAIAESILALGSGLRLKVLAEGIETKEEKEFFQFNGCNEMQGYLFSKPLPAKDVEKLLEKGFC